MGEEIDRIWGPYSDQARSFRTFVREHAEVEKRVNTKKSVVEEETPVTPKLSSHAVVNTVESATMAYFFTRAMFIVGSWIVFGTIVFGGMAALLFFYM